MKRKRDRSVIMNIRGGTAALQIEIGRWQGVEREETESKECQSGEVDDVCDTQSCDALHGIT